MTSSPAAPALLFRFRAFMVVFIVGLILSGVTAFPLLHELRLLARLLGLSAHAAPADHTGLAFWILTVRDGLEHTYAAYPWLAYGTDWLAFGHIVISFFFVGALLDPIHSRPTLLAGLVACAAVIPLALICGAVRGIPFYWRLIDCSFGIFGAIPLLYCLSLQRRIAAGP
jgi:hypothetical protein